MIMRISKYIYKVMLACVCVGLIACSEDQEGTEVPVGPEEDNTLEAVTIHIGASGTANTRAYGGDENAREHEFMNSLIAFIVDEKGSIEKVIHATDSASFQPESGTERAGNVVSYTTTTDLTPGKKTIYAFANMDKVKRVDNDGAISFEETLKTLKQGDVWPEEFATAVIEDPAASVDFDERGFIPMSVRQDADLTVNGQTVNVLLVRLVSRVDVKLTNQQGADVTVSHLKMTDFADRVHLFEGMETVPADAANKAYEQDLTLTVPSSPDPTQITTFYVNETWGRTVPFNIALTINDQDMAGNTVSRVIARNHILPLSLSLSNTNLSLTVTAQVAPIGGYPVDVYLDGDGMLTDNYAITLPEGCTFSITGKLSGNTGIETDITSWSWAVDTETSSDLVAIEGDGTEPTITGYLTALPNQKILLDFTITAQRYKEGTLTITTTEIGDAPWQSRSLTQWGERTRWYEAVPMMRKNP